MDNFGDWILERLKEKKWRQADLARAANLDTAVISNLINSKRGPGEDTCKAIARALDLPPETVFRAAGLLPELPSIDQARMEIFLYKFAELPPEKQEQVLEYMDFIQKRNTEPVKTNREGVAPPETVKGKVRT